MARIGLISDTHGLLRPEVFDTLQGVERILHAGDVGNREILTELETIAPVTAVFGNTDGWDIRAEVPETAMLEIAGYAIVVTHGHGFDVLRPGALRKAYPQAQVIVYGHTHQALVDPGETCLVVNPGAAGPARFQTRPSIALLDLTPAGAEARIIRL